MVESENAVAKKKTPANAMVLSMGFSCGVVLPNDAGLPMRRTQRARQWIAEQLTHQEKTQRFCGPPLDSGF
jgi:hypothetical protein